MATRIYVVTQGKNEYMVRAATQAAARSHIAKDIAVKVASQEALIALTKLGIVVQDASNAPA